MALLQGPARQWHEVHTILSVCTPLDSSRKFSLQTHIITGLAMYVYRNTVALSSNVYTSSAILRAWNFLTLYTPCIISQTVYKLTRWSKILMIRHYFSLDALHVSGSVSPSSGTAFISCTAHLVYAGTWGCCVATAYKSCSWWWTNRDRNM